MNWLPYLPEIMGLWIAAVIVGVLVWLGRATRPARTVVAREMGE